MRGGGRYVGFCGGAGLGLSDAADPCAPPKSAPACSSARGTAPKSASACSTSFPGMSASVFRAGIRLSRNVFPIPSPPVRTGHPHLVAGALCGILGGPGDGVDVLARYAGSDPRTCPPDLCVADLPLSSLSPAVLEQWIELYGVALAPGFLNGQPCALHGRYGEGSYTLSYSHLETPGSPDANRWFAHILRTLTGFEPRADTVPAWRPVEMPVLWHDPDLLEARRGMGELIRLGIAHDLLFERAPWLTGWRSGVPGSGLNTLFMGLVRAYGRGPVRRGRKALGLAARPVRRNVFPVPAGRRGAPAWAAPRHDHAGRSAAQDSRRAAPDVVRFRHAGRGAFTRN